MELKTILFFLKSDEEKQKFLGIKNTKMSDDKNKIVPQGEKIEMPLGQQAPASVKKQYNIRIDNEPYYK